jgi:hypothetical protein
VSTAGTALDTYRPVDEPYAWVDAVSGGTNLALTADDGAVTTSLPFSFSYFRQPFTTVSVGSNGLLVFGGGAATPYNNLNLPHPQLPNGIVAPLWDDLNPSAGGAVWKKVVGTAPNRRVVVEWAGVPHYPQTGAATFEAILEEGTSDIVFQWQDVQFGSATYDFGASASIGVENLDASLGREWSYNTASLAPYEGARAVRLTNGGPTTPPGPDTTPPAPPTALGASPGDRRVTLDWADNRESDLAGYRVYRDGTLIGSPTASQWADSGLTNGVSYAYRVTAVDAAGNESAPSATVSAIPVAAPVVRQYAPSAFTVATGTLSSGGLSSLGAQDGNRLVVSSARSGGGSAAELQASATVDIAPTKLTVEWIGSCSKSATVTVRVWNWTTGAWQTIDGPASTGSADRTVSWSTTSPSAFVSASGAVRVDVRATRGQSFELRTDLIRFTTES